MISMLVRLVAPYYSLHLKSSRLFSYFKTFLYPYISINLILFQQSDCLRFQITIIIHLKPTNSFSLSILQENNSLIYDRFFLGLAWPYQKKTVIYEGLTPQNYIISIDSPWLNIYFYTLQNLDGIVLSNSNFLGIKPQT